MSCTKSLLPRFSSRPGLYKACSAWKKLLLPFALIPLNPRIDRIYRSQYWLICVTRQNSCKKLNHEKKGRANIQKVCSSFVQHFLLDKKVWYDITLYLFSSTYFINRKFSSCKGHVVYDDALQNSKSYHHQVVFLTSHFIHASYT